MPSNTSVDTTLDDRKIFEIARAFFAKFALVIVRKSIEENINKNKTIQDSSEKIIKEKISHAKDLVNDGINKEQDKKTSVELDNKIGVIRQHYKTPQIFQAIHPSISETILRSLYESSRS